MIMAMRTKEDPLEMLVKLPWQASAVLGPFAFIVLRWIFPAIFAKNPSLLGIAMLCHSLAPLAFAACVGAASFSFILQRKRMHLVDDKNSLSDLKNMDWKDLELMVAEAFKRQDYRVDYSLRTGADGGVDLTLSKNGKISLVQCKKWAKFSVGVTVVREMYGIMADQKAGEGIIITTSTFTREAQNFAAGKPIKLIDGSAVLELIKGVQLNRSTPAARPVSDVQTCPVCSGPLVLKTVNRGQNAGRQFWGCYHYPRCKGPQPIRFASESVTV